MYEGCEDGDGMKMKKPQRLTLAPLSYESAVGGLLATKPPPKKKRRKKSKK
jgi:hypothetical protein